jgi:hypothetical protein
MEAWFLIPLAVLLFIILIINIIGILYVKYGR